MKQLCKMENISGKTTTAVAFHVQDDKGRWVGCEIILFRADMTPAPGASSGWHSEPGTRFFANVQATKDGKAWGASQGTSDFATAEDRAAYIEKTVAQRRKAAQKKFPVAA